MLSAPHDPYGIQTHVTSQQYKNNRPIKDTYDIHKFLDKPAVFTVLISGTALFTDASAQKSYPLPYHDIHHNR